MMDRFLECIKVAFLSMRTSKLRTTLTMLGVIIGVSSVIIIGTVAEVGKGFVFKELETFGLKSLWVYRIWEEKPGKVEKSGTGITNDDIEAIKEQCLLVNLVSPCLGKWKVWVKYKTRYAKVNIQGVDANYDKIANEHIEIGRFLTSTDIEHHRNVCIIGSDVYEKLFKGKEENPIDSQIYIEGRRYTIVGILKRKDRDFIENCQWQLKTEPFLAIEN
ncbi:MAG: ABC transporter permease [bacterium]